MTQPTSSRLTTHKATPELMMLLAEKMQASSQAEMALSAAIATAETAFEELMDVYRLLGLELGQRRREDN